MKVAMRGQVIKTQIHPGWLSGPKSAVDMLAINLGVTVSHLIQEFGIAVNSLVEEVIEHSRTNETHRYLKHLQEREDRELAAAAADIAARNADESTGSSLISAGSWQQNSLEKICRLGGFAAFLNWYTTDDWSCDEWFCFKVDEDWDDVRLQKWLDEFLTCTPDQENQNNYYFLDAEYLALPESGAEPSE